MINFIIAQVLGAIALVLMVISYFVKKKISFLFLQIIANLFYGLSFIFSSSLVAGINSIISILRVIQLYFYEKAGKTDPPYIIIIYSIIYIIVGIIFFNNILDIIPIITPIIFTIAMSMKNMQMVRYLMLPPNALLVFYAVMCQAYTTAILNFVEIIALIVAIIKFSIDKKKERANENDISKTPTLS